MTYLPCSCSFFPFISPIYMKKGGFRASVKFGPAIFGLVRYISSQLFFWAKDPSTKKVSSYFTRKKGLPLLFNPSSSLEANLITFLYPFRYSESILMDGLYWDKYYNDKEVSFKRFVYFDNNFPTSYLKMEKKRRNISTFETLNFVLQSVGNWKLGKCSRKLNQLKIESKSIEPNNVLFSDQFKKLCTLISWPIKKFC